MFQKRSNGFVLPAAFKTLDVRPLTLNIFMVLNKAIICIYTYAK